MMKKKLLPLLSVLILTCILVLGCGKNAAPADTPDGGDSAGIHTETTAPQDSPVPTDNASGILPNVTVGAFTTEDLNGNTVTESILKEKEYTMINVWGTYCGPCINEMPELEKLHQNMPENMQIIGMVCDLPVEVKPAQTLELANEIVKTTGVTYPSLMVYQDAYWFLDTTNVVPTTYFVDSEGNLASDIIYGADIEAYRAAIEKLGK